MITEDERATLIARGSLPDRIKAKAQLLETFDYASIAELLREAAREIELLRHVLNEDTNNG